MFLVYLKDIHLFQSENIKSVNYVGDTKLIIEKKIFEIVVEKANRSLLALREWFLINKLMMNESKTKFVFSYQK